MKTLTLNNMTEEIALIKDLLALLKQLNDAQKNIADAQQQMVVCMTEVAKINLMTLV